MPLGDPKIEGMVTPPAEKIVEQPRPPEEQKTPEALVEATKKTLTESTQEADAGRTDIETIKADHTDEVEGTASTLAPEIAALDATVAELNKQNSERKTIEAELDQLVAELNDTPSNKVPVHPSPIVEEPSIILDEKIKTYENPNDDPIIQATEEAIAQEANKMIERAQNGTWGKGVQQEATVDEPWASAMRNQRAAELHGWSSFVYAYPEKAEAYKNRIPSIKIALEQKARNDEEDRQKAEKRKADIAATSMPEQAANEQNDKPRNTAAERRGISLEERSANDQEEQNGPEKLRDLELLDREIAEENPVHPEHASEKIKGERGQVEQHITWINSQIKQYDQLILEQESHLQGQRNSIKTGESTSPEQQQRLERSLKVLEKMKAGREAYKKDLADAEQKQTRLTRREARLNESRNRDLDEHPDEARDHQTEDLTEANEEKEDEIESKELSPDRSAESRLEGIEDKLKKEDEHLAALEKSFSDEQAYLKEVEERRERERAQFEFTKQLLQDIQTLKEQAESAELTQEQRKELIERCRTQAETTPDVLLLENDEPGQPEAFIDKLLKKPAEEINKQLEKIDAFLEADKDGEYIENSKKRIESYEGMIEKTHERMDWYEEYRTELQQEISYQEPVAEAA